MIQEFASYSAIPANILKGKNLKRILWVIVDKTPKSKVSAYKKLLKAKGCGSKVTINK